MAEGDEQRRAQLVRAIEEAEKSAAEAFERAEHAIKQLEQRRAQQRRGNGYT